MNNLLFVVGIRDKNSQIVRHTFVTDDIEHTKREIRAALRGGKASPAYYSFPEEYEVVVAELSPKSWDTLIAPLSDFLPEDMPDFVRIKKDEKND